MQTSANFVGEEMRLVNQHQQPIKKQMYTNKEGGSKLEPQTGAISSQ